LTRLTVVDSDLDEFTRLDQELRKLASMLLGGVAWDAQVLLRS